MNLNHTQRQTLAQLLIRAIDTGVLRIDTGDGRRITNGIGSDSWAVTLEADLVVIHVPLEDLDEICFATHADSEIES